MVGNQKGGVGKSTLTTMLANHLVYTLGKKVCILDADYKQKSIKLQRDESDIPFLLSQGFSQKDIALLYPIWVVDSAKIFDKYQELDGEYDYIFIDLPGNIMQKGVITAFSIADLIISPMGISENDKRSTIQFKDLLIEYVIPARLQLQLKPAPHKIVLFRVTTKINEYKAFLAGEAAEYVKIHKFDFFENVIPERPAMLPRNLKTYPGTEHDILTKEYSDFYSEFEEIIKEL